MALQEVWVHSDYTKLCSDVASALPYSFYYRSGQVGSGLAVFSRFPIKETAFVPFTTVGAIDRIWQGDWFAGKGIGMARVHVFCDLQSTNSNSTITNRKLISTTNGTFVDIYVTHTHAQYGSLKYTAHRLVQLDELAHFIRINSSNAGIPAIVAGDLNTEIDELPYRLMLEQLSLQDPLITLVNKGGSCVEGINTNRLCDPGIESNVSTRSTSISSTKLITDVDENQRHENLNFSTFPSQFYSIKSAPARTDYILYYSGNPHNTSLQRLVFLYPVSFVIDRDAPLSDHCPIITTLTLSSVVPDEESSESKKSLPTSENVNLTVGESSITIPNKSHTTIDCDQLAERHQETIKESIQICQKIVRRLRNWQWFWDTLSLICFLGFLGITITCAVTIPNDQLTTLLILAFFAVLPILTGSMIATLFFGRIFYHLEVVAFRAAIDRWSLFLEVPPTENASSSGLLASHPSQQ